MQPPTLFDPFPRWVLHVKNNYNLISSWKSDQIHFPHKKSSKTASKSWGAAYQDNKASDTTPLVDILGQAIDNSTEEIFVLVQWAESTDDEMTWTPIRLLSPVTKTWWSSKSDRRFPHIDLTKEAPLLRLTGDFEEIPMIWTDSCLGPSCGCCRDVLVHAVM